jgi:hypothetical protein
MEARQKEEITCACGCGKMLYNYDSRWRPRMYISGHNVSKRVERLKLKCDWCGVEIEQLECKAKNYSVHFCSSSCRAKWSGNKNSNDMEYKERQRQLSKRVGNKPPIYTGERHWNWKGGISKVNRGQDYAAIQWRKSVLAKYHFTCQECGLKGGRMSAHHIMPWAEYKELRYEIKNGLCLCYTCHMRLHGLVKGMRKTGWKPNSEKGKK